MDFSLSHLWSSMGLFAKAIVIVMAFMSVVPAWCGTDRAGSAIGRHSAACARCHVLRQTAIPDATKIAMPTRLQTSGTSPQMTTPRAVV